MSADIVVPSELMVMTEERLRELRLHAVDMSQYGMEDTAARIVEAAREIDRLRSALTRLSESLAREIDRLRSALTEATTEGSRMRPVVEAAQRFVGKWDHAGDGGFPTDECGALCAVVKKYQ